MRRVVTFAGNHTNVKLKGFANRYRYLDYIWFDVLACLDTGQTQVDGSPRKAWCESTLLTGEIWIFVVKLLRVHGGCLGIRRR